MAKIGLTHVAWAPITAENEGTGVPTYGTGIILGRGIRATATENRADAKLYGDNKVAERANNLLSVDLEYELTELVEANAEAIGLIDACATATDGYEGTDDATNYGGTGYIEHIVRHGVPAYKGRWYYKAQLGRNADEARTRGDNVEFGTPTLAGEAMAIDDGSGKNKFYIEKVHATLTAALTWLKGKANIT